MKIGIDAKALSKRYTGVAIYLYSVIRYLTELDKNNEYVLFSNKEFSLDFELPKNFKKCIYRAKIGSFGVMFSLPKLIQSMKIDLFWGPEHIVPFTKSCPTIVTIHDLAVLMDPSVGTYFNAFLQKVFTLPSIKRSDSVIAISESTANDVVRLANIKRDKIHVIYNGDSPYTYNLHQFSDEECKMIQNKYRLNLNYFLFVGSIEPRKNISTIVRAFNSYKLCEHNDAKLVLAGGLGWKYKKTLKTISDSPYKKDIVLTGYCSEMEREYLYRNAKALIFPSLYEGFGFPIIEAFSVGIPVIVSGNSSLPEVAGSLGYYIQNPYDVNGIVNYMKYIDNIPDNEKLQKAIAYKKWAASFSRLTCTKQILNLFNSYNEDINNCK